MLASFCSTHWAVSKYKNYSNFQTTQVNSAKTADQIELVFDVLQPSATPAQCEKGVCILHKITVLSQTPGYVILAFSSKSQRTVQPSSKLSTTQRLTLFLPPTVVSEQDVSQHAHLSNVFGLVILIYGKWTGRSLAVDQNNKTKNIWHAGRHLVRTQQLVAETKSAAVSSTTLMTVALFADFLTKKPKWHSQEWCWCSCCKKYNEL